MLFKHDYIKQSYNEIPQERPCKLAFAKKQGNCVVVLHSPVLCRDFLNDTLVWKAGECTENMYIYGYDFCGDIDTEQTSLYLEDDEENPLKENIVFVHKLESELGLPLTKVTTDTNKNFFIQADKWWMTTTVHLSWFTYLLRQLTLPGEVVDSWEKFLHGSEFLSVSDKLPTLHKALAKLKVTQVSGTKKKYLEQGMDTIHDYNGFRSQLGDVARFTEYGNQLNELIET